MRIAMVAHTNAPWTPHYARYFLSKGHSVRVLSFSPNPLEGIDVVHLGDREPAQAFKPIWFAARLPRARRLLRRYRPDVVLATYLSSNGATAALCWGGPLVVSARGSDVLRRAGCLPAGYNHVGVHNDVVHLAATPVGLPVVASAELVEVDGRRLVFHVEAHDSVEKIGEGRHERMIVSWARFLERLEEKRPR